MQHSIYYYSVLYFHNQIQYRTILCFLQNLIEYLTAFRMSSYSFVLYTLYVRSFRITSSSMKGSISFSNLLISYVFYGSYSSSCVSQFVCLYTYHLLGDIFSFWVHHTVLKEKYHYMDYKSHNEYFHSKKFHSAYFTPLSFKAYIN